MMRLYLGSSFSAWITYTSDLSLREAWFVTLCGDGRACLCLIEMKLLPLNNFLGYKQGRNHGRGKDTTHTRYTRYHPLSDSPDEESRQMYMRI